MTDGTTVVTFSTNFEQGRAQLTLVLTVNYELLGYPLLTLSKGMHK